MSDEGDNAASGGAPNNVDQEADRFVTDASSIFSLVDPGLIVSGPSSLGLAPVTLFATQDGSTIEGTYEWRAEPEGVVGFTHPSDSSLPPSGPEALVHFDDIDNAAEGAEITVFCRRDADPEASHVLRLNAAEIADVAMLVVSLPYEVAHPFFRSCALMHQLRLNSSVIIDEYQTDFPIAWMPLSLGWWDNMIQNHLMSWLPGVDPLTTVDMPPFEEIKPQVEADTEAMLSEFVASARSGGATALDYWANKNAQRDDDVLALSDMLAQSLGDNEDSCKRAGHWLIAVAGVKLFADIFMVAASQAPGAGKVVSLVYDVGVGGVQVASGDTGGLASAGGGVAGFGLDAGWASKLDPGDPYLQQFLGGLKKSNADTPKVISDFFSAPAKRTFDAQPISGTQGGMVFVGLYCAFADFFKVSGQALGHGTDWDWGPGALAGKVKAKLVDWWGSTMDAATDGS